MYIYKRREEKRSEVFAGRSQAVRVSRAFLGVKKKKRYIYREISEAARLESRSDKERKKESSYKRKVSE